MMKYCTTSSPQQYPFTVTCNVSLFRGNLPSIGQGCWRKSYSGNISLSVKKNGIIKKIQPGGILMNRRRFCYLMVLGGLSLYTRPVFANKASTSIEAPQSVQKGSEVTIRVTVTHKGNSFLHYTKALQVIANKKEIARWDFTSGQRPEAEVFTKGAKP